MDQTMEVSRHTFTSIGYFRGGRKKKYDVPKQAILNQEWGEVILYPGYNFEPAIADLKGFSHIWLIYLFNNTTWKPKVQTPRCLNKKGVFATRSPYRPNPIGISCVELMDLKGLSLKIKNYDLIDDTQILDIKPYIEYSDKVSQSQQGWLENLQDFEIFFNEQSCSDLRTVSTEQQALITNFIKEQLSYAPLGHPNKRVKKTDQPGIYTLSYQYSRIYFEVSEQKITIQKINFF